MYTIVIATIRGRHGPRSLATTEFDDVQSLEPRRRKPEIAKVVSPTMWFLFRDCRGWKLIAKLGFETLLRIGARSYTESRVWWLGF